MTLAHSAVPDDIRVAHFVATHLGLHCLLCLNYVKNLVNPYPVHIFLMKCLLFFKCTLRTAFIMEANSMNANQQSDLGSYCLQ